MQFFNDEDKQLYELQLGSLDENTFLERHRSLVKKMTNFRKSQDAKTSWRRHRYNYEKGIKQFHKSTEGKVFHRKLGRFLATRIFEQNIDDDLMTDLAVSISSLITHIFLDKKFYKSESDAVDYEMFLSSVVPELIKLLKKIVDSEFSKDCITDDDCDIVYPLLDKKVFIKSISEVTNKPYEDLRKIFEQSNSLIESSEFNENYYKRIAQSLKSKLIQ